MKAIFLDIDGVLNCRPDCIKTKGKMLVGGDGCIGIYSPRVQNLAKIVETTGAKIVLVSSWKNCYISYLKGVKNLFNKQEDEEYPAINKYGKYLREKLRRYNLEIYDTTYYDEPNSGLRGTGIINWLNKHEVESWVVLDDEIFCDYESCGILDHLVKTSFYYGALDETHVEKAISILNS